MDPARRLLLVHAHPDDESIGTGATMARYAAEGAQVTLVTCTLGELGEIIPPDLAQLGADAEDRLGEYRIGELDAACAALGVTDHRYLGGPGRWRDSGMVGTEGNDDPRCFWRAGLDEAADALLGVIREVRPQVLVTYDANGFYGHPDHIQAHRVAWHAFQRAQQAGDYGLAKFYATAAPDSDQVTTEIDATAYLERKQAAMRAHATQITVDLPYFALSNQERYELRGVEYYTLLAGPRGPGGTPADPPGGAPGGREADLFSGAGLLASSLLPWIPRPTVPSAGPGGTGPSRPAFTACCSSLAWWRA